jgi:hypothetical protein
MWSIGEQYLVLQSSYLRLHTIAVITRMGKLPAPDGNGNRPFSVSRSELYAIALSLVLYIVAGPIFYFGQPNRRGTQSLLTWLFCADDGLIARPPFNCCPFRGGAVERTAGRRSRSRVMRRPADVPTQAVVPWPPARSRRARRVHPHVAGTTGTACASTATAPYGPAGADQAMAAPSISSVAGRRPSHSAVSAVAAITCTPIEMQRSSTSKVPRCRS